MPDTRELASSVGRLRRLAARLHVKLEGVLVQEMLSGGIELLLGSTRDSVFGPIVVLGMGGRCAELLQDYSIAIAPLGIKDARDIASRIKLGQLLSDYRGGPQVRTSELTRVVSRFSRILPENPSIEQIEANPLMASEDGIIAVDVRAAARNI